ncbi:tRNA-binding protein [Mycobacterium paragordonae]|uniref:tRNA-binding protein n=1 Tax=Mycobacterium paragordonae TaxID=1389713 RepID=A0AAJ1SKG4_9MYCO|nr:tRNA-binding protein [Mycobacterium paragordonae]MDP7739763.1 tRNA-binding protein [Mycobacterium paragordonae]
MPETVAIDTFLNVDIRAGRVIRAEQFPHARKAAYKLWIDFGELGVRRSSAQITDLYTIDELKDRLVLAVVNLPPRQIADFISEVLVLGIPTGGGRSVVLVGPDREVSPGLRLL